MCEIIHCVMYTEEHQRFPADEEEKKKSEKEKRKSPFFLLLRGIRGESRRIFGPISYGSGEKHV